jgi:hypothetical protein
MTTQAPLRSQWTTAKSPYHVQVTGDRDAPLSPLVKIPVKIQGCSSTLYNLERLSWLPCSAIAGEIVSFYTLACDPNSGKNPTI